MNAWQVLTEGIVEYIALAMIVSCFIVAFVVKGIVGVWTTSMRERSRREIAAYIAEGSMTPEQGERILRADLSDSGGPHPSP